MSDNNEIRGQEFKKDWKGEGLEEGKKKEGCCNYFIMPIKRNKIFLILIKI